MPTKREIEVFQFDELDDKAKEKAREWYREASAGDNYWSESVIEDAAQCAECLGIEFDQRPYKTMGGQTRYEPCVFWSGFWSQGDGACFEGTWKFQENYEARIKDHAPIDEKLHNIALTLDDLQQRNSGQLSARVKHSGHYNHSGCTDIEVSKIDGEGEELDVDDATYKEVKSALRSFMNWIYTQLQKEYEYQNSDEQVDDNIRGNQYEFHKDGRRVTF